MPRGRQSNKEEKVHDYMPIDHTPPKHFFKHDKKLDLWICCRCNFVLGTGEGRMPDCEIH